ncbi:MAG TPA: M28 family peptidase, partial [Flavisolibacter sp.]
MNRVFPVFLILFLAAACDNRTASQTEEKEEGLQALNADSLAQNIRTLSADDFMGRKPFTEGEKKTIDFLQQKFSQLGLEPGNNGSFLQEVPMVNIETTADSVMQVQAPGGTFTLRGLHDYVLWTERTDPQVTLNQDDVVFAGYGVVAPEYNWNDYAGVDVKGKIVMVMVNDPGYGVDSALFKGDTMTYYGRWTYKFEEAARQGAKACIIIHKTKPASYPFTVVQNNWNGSRLRLNDQRQYCTAVGWVSEEAAAKLLQAAGQDTTLYAKANQRGFVAQPLPLKLSTTIRVKTTYNKTYNVIAKIPGASKPDECIIYTAHWDHLGIGKPDEKGDSIYNGALDNASGTAGLIELARAFKSLEQAPARTIVFLAVTAEEQGLWGSAYYAQNPVFPVSKTVANINMDGLNLLGKAKDLIIVGKGQSDLEDSLENAADQLERKVTFETHPEAGYYYRSDHFNFAKVGIPALYTARGIEIEGKDAGYGKKADEDYRAQHYHR